MGTYNQDWLLSRLDHLVRTIQELIVPDGSKWNVSPKKATSITQERDSEDGAHDVSVSVVTVNFVDWILVSIMIL